MTGQNSFTKEDLIQFEKDIIEEWKKANTYGPIHLSGGNEQQLIDIFEDIKKDDWVFSTHRSHYHALLKTKDKKWLTKEIIVKARSSHINSREHKFFTSAIVCGSVPIALGVALALKLKKKKSKVYCFIGDMASEMGAFDEALKYAIGENLPIKYVIEDNDLGCDTPTNKVWKLRQLRNNFLTRNSREFLDKGMINTDKAIYYSYRRFYPHVGCGVWLTQLYSKASRKKFQTMGGYDAYKQ